MNHFGNKGDTGTQSLTAVRFGLPHLFLAMLVFSVTAWLFSIGYVFTGAAWLGWSAGVAFSRRNRYSPFLMGFMGLMIGVLYLGAVGLTMSTSSIYNSSAIDSVASKSKTIASEFRVVLICLVGTLWFVALATTIWLVTSTFRRYTTLNARESEVSRHLVSDRVLLTSTIVVVLAILNLQARNLGTEFPINVHGWPFDAVTNHSISGITIHWAGAIVNTLIWFAVLFASISILRRRSNATTARKLLATEEHHG